MCTADDTDTDEEQNTRVLVHYGVCYLRGRVDGPAEVCDLELSSVSSRRFSGLMSLWITFFSCSTEARPPAPPCTTDTRAESHDSQLNKILIAAVYLKAFNLNALIYNLICVFKTQIFDIKIMKKWFE